MPSVHGRLNQGFVLTIGCDDNIPVQPPVPVPPEAREIMCKLSERLQLGCQELLY